MPRIRFGAGEREHCRRYTRFFGSQGDAAPSLCHYGLNHYEDWEQKIETWQGPILQNGDLSRPVIKSCSCLMSSTSWRTEGQSGLRFP
ncbi:hypothetical protein FKM82_030136 [Ascaphus truei]